jgi:hypothetical protein
VKILLLVLLAFAAVQPGGGRKPKPRRKTRDEAETAVSHQEFYQQDKLMTQEIEALIVEVKQHATSTSEQQTS